jgi:hypothetical protein
VVQQQARLIVRDLLKSTPPHGTRPLTESFGFQRRKGQLTADRDVARLYQPLTSIRAVMAPEPRGSVKPSRRDFLKHLAEAGKWTELSEALFDMRVTDDHAPIQGTLTFEEYRSTWNLFRGKRSGSVSAKRARKVLVWDGGALKLVREKIGLRIGWAKAGWMASVRKLAVKGVPTWISRHPAPGGCVVQDAGGEYSITLTNSVSYIAYLNSGNRLLNRVLANRERAMEITLEHAIEHSVEEFNAA